jgi:hypothetical protein
MDAIPDAKLQMALNSIQFHDSLGRSFSYRRMGIFETKAIETHENNGMGRGRKSAG